MLKERINQLKSARRNKAASKFIVAISLTLMASLLAIANANVAKTSDDIKAIVRINPQYPVEAAENKIEGFVHMVFDVNTQGRVSNIRVIESSPKGTFDQNAKYALSRWKYENRTGATVSSAVQLEFKLEEDPVETVSIIAQ